MSKNSERVMLLINVICGSLFGFFCFHAFFGAAFCVGVSLLLGMTVLGGTERLFIDLNRGLAKLGTVLLIDLFVLGLTFLAIWQKVRWPSTLPGN